MEVRSKRWCERSLDCSGQTPIELPWNGEYAWRHASDTWRNFNVDVGCLKRIEEGGLLLSSNALSILPCYAEASQIFKLESRLKEDIFYQAIDFTIRLGRCTGVLPVHDHFNWFVSVNRSWRRWWNRHWVISSSLVKILVGNKRVRVEGWPVKVLSQQAKWVCRSPKSTAQDQMQAWLVFKGPVYRTGKRLGLDQTLTG